MVTAERPLSTKEQQEEEAALVAKYGDCGAAALGGLASDQCDGQITNAQWAGDAVAPAFPAVCAAGWTPDAVPIAGDGWDAATAPPMAAADMGTRWLIDRESYTC